MLKGSNVCIGCCVIKKPCCFSFVITPRDAKGAGAQNKSVPPDNPKNSMAQGEWTINPDGPADKACFSRFWVLVNMWTRKSREQTLQPLCTSGPLELQTNAVSVSVCSACLQDGWQYSTDFHRTVSKWGASSQHRRRLHVIWQWGCRDNEHSWLNPQIHLGFGELLASNITSF